MEILEAFDLTGTLRGAAQLVGCDHKTVAHWVRARDEAGGEWPPARVGARDQPDRLDGGRDVRASSENHLHGSSLGAQLRRLRNGVRFRYVFAP